MVSNVKAKKLNNKLRGASAGIQDFVGATKKHLKQHVIPSLVDDTPDIAVTHGGCNDLGYKNKEALSTDDIVNAILISSLISRKNNLQNNKINIIDTLFRSARDSLGFRFIDNSSIARNHEAGDAIH